MRIRFLRARDLDDGQVIAWSRVQASIPEFASPFFRPEFIVAAAQEWDRVQVGVIEDGNSTVGFFPFERDLLGVGRPVAAMVCDFQGVVVGPDVAWSADELLRGCGLASMEFNHLVASQAQFATCHLRTAPSPRIDVSSGFDAYKRGRRDSGSEQIKKLEGLGRKMEREIGPFRFEPDSDDPRAFAWLVEQKSRQCAARGFTDALGTPGIHRFVERLLAARGPEFAGSLSVLRAGDRIVAAHLGMRSRTVWHYWFPCYDEELAKYSPGLLLLLRIVEHAPTIGVRTIDLGRGDAPYKTRFMTDAVEVADARVESRASASLVARALVRGRDRARRAPWAGGARRLYRWLRYR